MNNDLANEKKWNTTMNASAERLNEEEEAAAGEEVENDGFLCLILKKMSQTHALCFMFWFDIKTIDVSDHQNIPSLPICMCVRHRRFQMLLARLPTEWIVMKV